MIMRKLRKKSRIQKKKNFEKGEFYNKVQIGHVMRWIFMSVNISHTFNIEKKRRYAKMLRKKLILCSMIALMTLLCNMPVPVQAAEGVLQTEVLAVREED